MKIRPVEEELNPRIANISNVSDKRRDDLVVEVVNNKRVVVNTETYTVRKGSKIYARNIQGLLRAKNISNMYAGSYVYNSEGKPIYLSTKHKVSPKSKNTRG